MIDVEHVLPKFQSSNRGKCLRNYLALKFDISITTFSNYFTKYGQWWNCLKRI